jgi:hypothetical protein
MVKHCCINALTLGIRLEVVEIPFVLFRALVHTHLQINSVGRNSDAVTTTARHFAGRAENVNLVLEVEGPAPVTLTSLIVSVPVSVLLHQSLPL